MTAKRITAGLAGVPTDVDVVVVGLGVTGAGVALDAASRGLRVLAVDAHDLAFGTSRWSSKLVHGGLRYLASGQVGVAHESAVERGILMDVVAPHLVHPMASVLPLLPGVSAKQAGLARVGFLAGDLLRRGAGTPASTLPRPRRISASEALLLVPDLNPHGLRGALMSWDGQLEDDARLVVTIARTAAHHGASVHTRARVLHATGREVRLRDELTGAEVTVTTRTVINAAGVWAGSVSPDVKLRPSRGTHLVVRKPEGQPDVAIFAPIPGSTSRFVMVLPQPDGTRYVGLTDEPVEGPIPDVPSATEEEIEFLLDVAGRTLREPLTREDVIGTYSGLRPLLDGGPGETSDLSRRHAVLTSPSGVVTIVGGKLTTYRRMAEDAVDAAIASANAGAAGNAGSAGTAGAAGAAGAAGSVGSVGSLTAGPCVTKTLPLLGAPGAAPRADLAPFAAEPALFSAEPAPISGEPRLVRRFGTDARLVADTAREVSGLSDNELFSPIADGVPVTLAELIFGVLFEGACDVDDLLDRRTRVGLIPADRIRCVPAAERALALAREGSAK